ncbi:MAG: asparagine synthase (glutamine-hydrolyzing) [Vicinamibacteria bacterium]
MCGIAGILHFGEAPPLGESLRRMASALRHRGPDAEGIFEDRAGAPAIGLAHRRLSVIDLSQAADQPMANEDGSVQVLLNGEIYNYRELRQRLTPRYAFRTQSDTEAVVHGYEQFSDDVVQHLDGMFALAVWDGRRRRLLVARDRFGKKPLYYWSDSERFVFGSEIKALLAAGAPVALADENLPEYLAFGYVPTPRTLFRGIRKLPPAATLVVDAGGLHEPAAYWDLRFPKRGEEHRVPLGEAASRVRELLNEAVRKRMVADVPVGLLLSGGLDSSAVAAMMATHAPGRVKTFTVGFEGDDYFDERGPAEVVARHLATEHRASVVRPDAAALIEVLLDHHDEPFGDSSALPTYLVAREARKHVTVVLNGDGGDELFAGYEHFRAALAAASLSTPIRNALSLASRLLPEVGHRAGPLRRLRRFAEKAGRSEIERLIGWTSFIDIPVLEALGGPAISKAASLGSSYRTALAGMGDGSALSRLLYLNARTYLLDDLLPKMDRMTMAHGLEARSPFLDPALAEYVACLPDSYKRKGAEAKIVLREAMRSLLPAPILERRKHGFGLPLGAWFRSELRELAESHLLDAPRLATWLSSAALRELLFGHHSGHADRGGEIWTLLTLELWLRRHRLG